jgi:hypothetical protein
MESKPQRPTAGEASAALLDAEAARATGESLAWLALVMTAAVGGLAMLVLNA